MRCRAVTPPCLVSVWGTATGASIAGGGAAVGADDTLYIADAGANRVRLAAGAADRTLARTGFMPWHAHRSVRLASGLSASVDLASGLSASVDLASGLSANVDLADGHLDVTADDLSLPARGPSLALRHT